MTILITGHRGRIGIQAMDWAQARGLDVQGLDLPDDLFAWSGEAETIIHLAVAWNDPSEVYDMTRHLLAHTRGLRRFVLASSISVDPACGLVEVDEWHVAAKLGAELWTRAWARTTGGTAVALRLGHCIRGSEPPPAHEALRLTERGLGWWLERALGDEPAAGALTIWNAVGDGGQREHGG